MEALTPEQIEDFRVIIEQIQGMDFAYAVLCCLSIFFGYLLGKCF